MLVTYFEKGISKMNENNNQTPNLNRRDFLKKSTGLAIAGAGTMMFANSAQASQHNQGWSHLSGGSADIAFWQDVRNKFVLDASSTYMNIGTTGSMPHEVLKQYSINNNIVATSPWDMQNKFGGWPHTKEMTDAIAPGFGANPDEIVISRNTTDGMVSIINGLDFQEGDVILTTHHEHVAANSPLDIAARRYDAEVVYLEIPVYTGNNKIKEKSHVNTIPTKQQNRTHRFNNP